MLSFAAFPLAAFFILFLFFFRYRSFSFRLAFLWASILWAVYAVFLTEILSLFRVMVLPMVIGGWVAGILVGLLVVIKSKKLIRAPIEPKKFSTTERSILAVTGLIILLLVMIAIQSSPNNWDSMTYHLARILHWIQNQSVLHYPTSILRQLYQPPGAEFLILQFQILTGGDRFANLVQWFAMVGSVVVLTLIAQQFGASRRGQIFTAFLVVTIPMGILQAVSTQNDYVAGFWLCAFVYFMLILIRANSDWKNRIGAGLALGLALLTKGTIYIFAIPWLIWLVVSALIKKRKSIFLDLIVIVLLAAALNAGFYSRNIQLFGSPLSPGEESYVNRGPVVLNTLTNAIRNASLHWGTSDPSWNAFLKNTISSVLKSNDANTWGDFEIPAWSTNEDIVGNPFHGLLFAGAMVYVFLFLPGLRPYALAVLASYLFFCGLFKWQLFNSRLLLPLFLLCAPFAAIILEKIKPKALAGLLCVVFIFAALPPLLKNERHPVLGEKNIFNMNRLEQYFSYRKFMALPYVFAVQKTEPKKLSEVGLWLGGDDWEYPLWVLLKKENPNLKIRHVFVKNVSATLRDGLDKPLRVISEIENSPEILPTTDAVYVKRQKFSFMSIYEKTKP